MKPMVLNFNLPKWNIEEETGYKPVTTFWDDFSIADIYGKEAIEDTFERAFNEWKGNIKYLAELYLVVNHKSWYWDARKNREYVDTYISLNDRVYDYVYGDDTPLTHEELSYFFAITD